MLPRKRQRLNRAGPCSQPTTALSRESATSRAPEAPQPQPQPPPPLLRSHRSIAALSTTSGNEKRPVRPAMSGDEKQIRKAKSWYGASPRTPTKAAASTSVARENILGGTLRPSRPPDLGRFEPKRADDAASLRSAHTAPPRPSVPQRAMTTDDGRPPPLDGPAKDAAGATHAGAPSARPRRMASSGWLGWWASAAPAPGGRQPESTAPPRTEEPRLAVPAVSGPPASDSASTASAPPAQAPTSWFGFWLSSTDASRVPEPAAEDAPSQGGDAPDAEMTDAPAPPGPAPKVGSTWAFWSRAPPKTGKDAAAAPEAGEIAVMGEGSEARPQPVAEGDVSGPRSGADQAATDAKAKQSRKTAWRTRKGARPAAAAAAAEPTQPANLLLPCFTSTYALKEDASVLRQVANLLLRISSTPPPSSSQPAAAGKHVLRVRQPPRIRRAVAIGVHGLMPAPYLRPMIGQPTGTSLRFATLAAEAIGRWAAAHGCADCAVDKVALEGEGRVGERVDNLWKLMLNWIDQLRRADLIVVASHSQGVPVSVMLLDKLVDLGLVAGGARIGVCAMAGVALGPFADYRSSILMGSAAELWEFGDPHSAVSRRFEAALARILDHGARVTFIGSIDDQLVPMESAVYSPASHPYIYRAVFIDGRVHAPDFIVHLVGFALKLRNLGISDHGLIRELSAPLAGSLYSGEGHSRLYYDAAVYDLAVAHALETSTVPRPAAAASPVRPPHPVASAAPSADGGAVGAAASPPNPYVLPWIMCGVLEEDFVKTELGAETDELLRQFDAWRPATKALRDVKYRLEAVRSRL